MLALSTIRCGRLAWRVLPWRAVRCGGLSLVVLLTSLFVLDRLALPILERKGLTAGDDWARHNAIVVAEHQRADNTIPFPETPMPAVSAGVRSWVGQTVDVTKRPGLRRILVMGDSFVWGSPYLTLNHMWWRQLAQILEPHSIEVIALGRPGASTRDQLQWAKFFVPRYEPDLIIWGYVTNDADEGLVRQIDTSHQSIPRLDRVRNVARHIWPKVMSKFDALRSNKLSQMYTGPKYGYEYSEWERKLVEPENLAVYARTVRDVKQFLDETQIPSFMMTLPNAPSAESFGPRLTPILKIWRDAGIAAHDVIPEFVRRYGESSPSGSTAIQWGINPSDGHPGPRTCRFLAEQAADVIRRDFPQLLGTFSPKPDVPMVNDWLPFQIQRPDSLSVGTDAWEMEYPADESRCPTMPLGIPTALLAFRQPVLLNSIRVQGSSLVSTRVWVTCLDKDELFDDGQPHDLGERQGADLVWAVPTEIIDRRICTVRFQSRFSNSRHDLRWSFLMEQP